MFSLKNDLLFSSIVGAKEIAKRINARSRACDMRDANPHEIQRMRDELRSAREAHRLKMSAHRSGIL